MLINPLFLALGVILKQLHSLFRANTAHHKPAKPLFGGIPQVLILLDNIFPSFELIYCIAELKVYVLRFCLFGSFLKSLLIFRKFIKIMARNVGIVLKLSEIFD